MGAAVGGVGTRQLINKIDARMHKRLLVRLDRLDVCAMPGEMKRMQGAYDVWHAEREVDVSKVMALP